MSTIKNPEGFRALDLPPSIQKKIDQLGFTKPTPIQEAAIPPLLEGRDVVGIAQTGTGKTLAFGIPLAARINSGSPALVLAPTRELAQQIQETLRKIGLQCALLIGGAPMGPQIKQIRNRPDVIVATPGRLIDHMTQKTLKLHRVSAVVLDEADRMLDMGFAPDIKRILDTTPESRQTMLFSATMPKEIADLAQRYLVDPERIEIAQAGTTAETVEQELVVVPHEQKGAMLAELLADHKGSVLVFTRTRHGARKTARIVTRMGHTAAELHSDRTLAQRRTALAGFKSGKFRVLVATDIAARGIDVTGIELVINYDVPGTSEDYVHRIGRTGRAGLAGRAITLATPEQHKEIHGIEKMLKAELPLSPRSTQALERPAPKQGRINTRPNKRRWRWKSTGTSRF